MITDVILPKFNMDMESAVLIRWLRREGDRVAAGDPVAEVETDKVNMEVEATADGVLFDLRYAEGDVVPVSVPIARIASDEAELTAAAAASRAAPDAPVGFGGGAPSPSSAAATAMPPDFEPVQPLDTSEGATRPSDEGALAPSRVSGRLSVPGRPRATPAARRLARELGVDLVSVARSGERLTAARLAEVAAALERPRPPAPPNRAGDETLAPGPAGGSRQRDQGGASEAGSAPQVLSLWTEVRVSGPLIGKESQGHEPTPPAIWVFLVARVLRDHPRLNALYRGGRVEPHAAIDIALQVPGGGGLSTIVLRDADRQTLFQLDDTIRTERRRERSGRSEAGDDGDGTFTIVDLDEVDVDGFIPVLRQPQVATLGIGCRRPRVAAAGEGLRVEERVQLSLACDARAVDEGQAASFLASLRRLVMSPTVVETALMAAESVGDLGVARR